jgi:hypothetical protein
MNSTNKEKKSFLPNTVTREQAKDTGMAMVLICLLVWYFFHFDKLFILSIVLLIINMIVPQIYKPIAKIWFGLSNVLGAVMSRILLTIIFFVLVTPIGVFRRMMGIDSLQLKKWKKDQTSVFKVRDHTCAPNDIDKPY